MKFAVFVLVAIILNASALFAQSAGFVDSIRNSKKNLDTSYFSDSRFTRNWFSPQLTGEYTSHKNDFIGDQKKVSCIYEHNGILMFMPGSIEDDTTLSSTHFHCFGNSPNKDNPQFEPEGSFYSFYYESQKLYGFGKYSSGEQGLWQYFYPNEKRMSEGAYLSGRPIGIWKFYDTTGTVVKSYDYSSLNLSKGILVDTFFYPNGKIRCIESYQLKRISVKKAEQLMLWNIYLYYGSGFTLAKPYPINKNNKWYQKSLEGEFSTYYQTGELQAKGQFKNNEPQGVWTCFSPSGRELTIHDFSAKE